MSLLRSGELREFTSFTEMDSLGRAEEARPLQENLGSSSPCASQGSLAPCMSLTLRELREFTPCVSLTLHEPREFTPYASLGGLPLA